MGYIMPVDRYQYIQYQERLSNDDSSLSPVNSIFRTTLDSTYKEVTNNADREVATTSQRIPTNPGKNNPEITERIYAEITGSGRHFNEAI